VVEQRRKPKPSNLPATCSSTTDWAPLTYPGLVFWDNANYLRSKDSHGGEANAVRGAPLHMSRTRSSYAGSPDAGGDLQVKSGVSPVRVGQSTLRPHRTHKKTPAPCGYWSSNLKPGGG